MFRMGCPSVCGSGVLSSLIISSRAIQDSSSGLSTENCECFVSRSLSTAARQALQIKSSVGLM